MMVIFMITRSSGDVFYRGIRETGSKGNLVNLNVICQITKKTVVNFRHDHIEKILILREDQCRLKYFLQPKNLLI